ncbi:MAG: hypothetical protein ACRD0U_17300, partial [Acidimicrobiales bacterium]
CLGFAFRAGETAAPRQCFTERHSKRGASGDEAAAKSAGAGAGPVPRRARGAGRKPRHRPGAADGGVVRSGGGVLGTADAQVITVTPVINEGLRLPATFGSSAARIDGSARTARSIVTDFGLLGTVSVLCIAASPTLHRLGIPTDGFATALPEASVADSREQPEVEASPLLPSGADGPLRLGGGHERAVARPDGEAHARTEMSDARLDLGVITVEMNGGVSDSFADPTTVRARTELSELRILAAGVEVGALRGLSWSFDQVLGEPASTSFTLGSARIGLSEFLAPSPKETAGLVAGLNGVIAPFGLSLSLPEPRPDGGITPLRIALLNSPLGAQLVQPLFANALSRLLGELEAPLLDVLPETGCVTTAANVLIAALTGQGGLAIDLGGAKGAIGTRPVEEFAYGTSAAPLPLSAPAIPTAPPAAGGSPTPGGAEPASAPAAPSSLSSPPPGSPGVAERVIALVTDRTTPAVVIVLLGLAATVALVVVERRRIARMVEAAR